MQINNDYKTKKYFKNRKNTCDYVVLHHTGKGEDLNLVKYLAYNKAQVSCHYVIGRTGIVYKLAPETRVTRHAGASKRDGKTNLNNHSIGIEIVSDGHSFTDEQRVSARKLIKEVIERWRIPIEGIIRHKDIAPGRKRDIGDSFWNKYFPSWKAYQESYNKNTFLERIRKEIGDERHRSVEDREKLHMLGKYMDDNIL